MDSTVYAGLRNEQSGFETWPGHYTVFFRKTLFPHSASLHLGVKMGSTGGLTAGNKTSTTTLVFD